MARREYDDLPLTSETERTFGQDPEGPSGAGRWLAVIAVLVLVGGGAWYFWQRKAPDDDQGSAPSTTAAPPAESAPMPTPEPAAPAVPLPELAASDEFVRQLLIGLSEQPRFARWLAGENLVRRFVAAVDNIAEGTSPATHLRPVAPDGAFRTSSSAGEGPPVIDPASYRRYDPWVETFVAMPSARLALLYRELHPLFDQAYLELGYPGRSFDDRLRQAIANLLAVEIPADPVALKRRVITYEYADPELESRSAAAKHLMRLGPENAERVQSKLREIATAIGISVS